jgi:hypothetical protein
MPKDPRRPAHEPGGILPPIDDRGPTEAIDRNRTDVGISGTISNVGGQAAIGTDIQQTQTWIDLTAAPTAEELQQLAAAFTSLKAEIERDALPEVREEAIQQAEALEQATVGPEPNVSAMATARRWFLEHAPKLFGAVTAVIINPIVGKVVQTAGDAIAEEYRRRFPEAATDSP